MKRVIGVILAVAFLSGIAVTAQVFSNREVASSVEMRSTHAADVSGRAIPAVQIDGTAPFPESVSIVLSSRAVRLDDAIAPPPQPPDVAREHPR